MIMLIAGPAQRPIGVKLINYNWGFYLLGVKLK